MNGWEDKKRYPWMYASSAATNRDLEASLSEGRFREDLYYRLKVVTISLPPLMERKDDIPLLSKYFLSRFADEAGMSNPGISREAMAVLTDYVWPGNVRELANTIQKVLIFNRGAPVSPEDINQAIGEGSVLRDADKSAEETNIHQWVRSQLSLGGSDRLFDACMDRIGGIIIGEALNMTGGNRSKAAKLLGLSRPTLHSKIEKYRLKFETSVTEDPAS